MYGAEDFAAVQTSNGQMAEREHFTIDAGGVPLAAERWHGDGPSVVLLHAGVADRRAWNGVADRLAGAHDVVAYDRRGYGETPFVDGGFSDVSDLGAVLRALGSEPAWLVGNSMGGAVALDAALQFPTFVAGLVLIGNAVSGWPESTGYAMDDATRALEERYARASALEDREELQRVAAWLWLDGPNESEGRVGGAPRALLREMVAGISRRNEFSGRRPEDPTAWLRLESIDVPAVIACGEFDTFLITPLQEVARRMPKAVFHLLRGTAHLPMLDQPEVIADLIAGAVGRQKFNGDSAAGRSPAYEDGDHEHADREPQPVDSPGNLA
jgi:pimeloyl-ACP methyl ester carboxylesterase